MFNPYQSYMQPFQAPQNQLTRVNGIESARAYQTAPSSTVALFDSNDDIMYIKSTDASNFPTIRRFRFIEDPDLTNAKTIHYVTADELEDFKAEVLKDVKQSIQAANKQITGNNGAGKPTKSDRS